MARWQPYNDSVSAARNSETATTRSARTRASRTSDWYAIHSGGVSTDASVQRRQLRTSLCSVSTTGTSVDSVSPPEQCQSNPGVREVGWIAAGGGYSILFPRPTFQDVLPPGSTYVGSSVGAPGPNSNMRGVPDIGYQASSHTGVLVYMTLGATKTSGPGCGGAIPCSPGWYTVGGTSSGSPQWAGIAALADQMAGRDIG